MYRFLGKLQMLRDVPPLLLLLLSIWFAKKSIKGKSVSIKQFSYNLVSSPPHESIESFSAVAHPVIENIPTNLENEFV